MAAASLVISTMIEGELICSMKECAIAPDPDVPIKSSKPPAPPCLKHHCRRSSLDKLVLKKLGSETPPQSPGSGRLRLLRKRSSTSAISVTTCYVGPPPLGRDGMPLRSCLIRAPSCPSAAGTVVTNSFTDSDDGSVSKKPRSVSFTHVQLREYCREVGDNPSVTSGPPLTIGWKYNTREILDIDSYEADKACESKECRRLTPRERERLLKEIARETDRRIMTAQMQAQMDQQRRWDTLDQIGGLKNAKNVSHRERLLLMKESLNRACKGKSTAKEQRMLWENAQTAAQNASKQKLSASAHL